MGELVLERSVVAPEQVSLSCSDLFHLHTDDMMAVGSNVIVAGTALFGAKDPADVIKGFKAKINDSRDVWGTDQALDKLT